METTHGKKVVRELKMVGDMYFNNFGVKVYLLENDEVLMQAVKMGKRIYGHYAILDKDYFDSRFRDEDYCAIDRVIDALQYLEPMQYEE